MIKGKKELKDLDQKDKELIKSQYYSGKSYDEIGALIPCSQRAVKSCLISEGVNTRLKNRYTLNDHYFDCIDSEVKAYLLGFLFADGFVGDEKHSNIVVSVKEGDSEICDLIKSELEYTGDIRCIDGGGFGENHKQNVINFSSISMANCLRGYGIVADRKKIAETIFPVLNCDLERHFLRGYFDGDGSFSVHANSLTVKGKRYTYQKGIFSIIVPNHMIGIFYSMLEDVDFSETTSKTNYMSYIQTSKQKSLVLIYHYLYDYSTVYLRRKYDVFTKYIGAITEDEDTL